MSRSKPSGIGWQPRDVYTLHLVPAYRHAKHYTGSTEPGRVPKRMAEHASGGGARLTQVQREHGGSWVLASVEPGTRDREQQLKERGRSRDCGVCKAERGYKAGELDAEQALKAAGWDRATRHEKELLVQTLGIPEVPGPLAADLAKPEPEPVKPIVQKWPQPVKQLSAEDEALSDRLVAKWRAELNMPQVPEPRREREYELEAG
jgi:predicted GIY-YIG superfamily endonuclease